MSKQASKTGVSESSELAPQTLESSTPITKEQNKAQAISWDEWTIAEHDKDRGTRQVIDEPKTPFVTSQNLKEAALAEALELKLNEAKDEQEKTEENKKAFEEKRKRHYNMGSRMKEAMRIAQKSIEEEDSDKEQTGQPNDSEQKKINSPSSTKS